MTKNKIDPFGRFYKDNLSALRAYVARLLPRAADSEDIANEAFAKVLAVSSKEHVSHPRAYLYTTAHNMALSHRRNQNARGEIGPVPDIEIAADPAPDAERRLLARERLVQLQDALEDLPPLRREIFYLRKIERLENKEIAKRLDISLSSVEKHIAQSLRACRNHLDTLDRLAEDDDLPSSETATRGIAEHG